MGTCQVAFVGHNPSATVVGTFQVASVAVEGTCLVASAVEVDTYLAASASVTGVDTYLATSIAGGSLHTFEVVHIVVMVVDIPSAIEVVSAKHILHSFLAVAMDNHPSASAVVA